MRSVVVQDPRNHSKVAELPRETETASDHDVSPWTTRLAAAAAGAGVVLAVLALVDGLLGLRRGVKRPPPPPPARRRLVGAVPDWLRRAGDSQDAADSSPR
jgi:negative regulator of sigma E activity